MSNRKEISMSGRKSNKKFLGVNQLTSDAVQMLMVLSSESSVHPRKCHTNDVAGFTICRVLKSEATDAEIKREIEMELADVIAQSP